MDDNFENIKVGDIVAWNARYGNGTVLAEVEKVTKTMFTANGLRFNKKTGRSVGSDSWNVVFAFIPTEGQVKTIKEASLRRKLINFLAKFNYSSLSFEDLTAIYNIVKKKDAEQ
jgi:hypothetical protein